jgi:hypothetical protein
MQGSLCVGACTRVMFVREHLPVCSVVGDTCVTSLRSVTLGEYSTHGRVAAPMADLQLKPSTNPDPNPNPVPTT